MRSKNVDISFFRFVTIHSYDRETDGQKSLDKIIVHCITCSRMVKIVVCNKVRSIKTVLVAVTEDTFRWRKVVMAKWKNVTSKNKAPVHWPFRNWSHIHHETKNISLQTFCDQGRINHSGAPYQRKAGALFSYAKPGFSYLWRCTFSPKKLTTFFKSSLRCLSVHWMFKRQNSVVQNWQLIGGGPLAAGAPSHGTTGTMDNTALSAIF